MLEVIKVSRSVNFGKGKICHLRFCMGLCYTICDGKRKRLPCARRKPHCSHRPRQPLQSLRCKHCLIAITVYTVTLPFCNREMLTGVVCRGVFPAIHTKDLPTVPITQKGRSFSMSRPKNPEQLAHYRQYQAQYHRKYRREHPDTVLKHRLQQYRNFIEKYGDLLPQETENDSTVNDETVKGGAL